MLDALRTESHQKTQMANRLKQGVDPFQPVGVPPALMQAPTFLPGEIADARPIATFVASAQAELALLDIYQTEAYTMIDWSLRHLMQASRSETLLNSLAQVTTYEAMLFPTLGFAISPPARWRTTTLQDAVISVRSTSAFQHTLRERTTIDTPGDPLGVVSGDQAVQIELRWPVAQPIRMFFMPLYPVIDGTLTINEREFLPMKTSRGLYFWLGTQVTTTLTLTLHMGGRPCLVGAPLIADGDWERAGEVTLTVPNILSPILVNTAASGAIFSVRTANIQEWVEVAVDQSLSLPVSTTTQISFPVNHEIVIPPGLSPKRIYRGQRSWYLERSTRLSDGSWQLLTADYLPLEATSVDVGAAEQVVLRTYLTSHNANVLAVTINGVVTVNGVVQSIGQIMLPAGDAELIITLLAGTHRFFVPVPPEIGMRARYTIPPYQLVADRIIMPDAPLVPHELLLASDDRLTLALRVGLPVTQGRPAIVADLRIT